MSCEVAYPWLWPVIMLAGGMIGAALGSILVDTLHRLEQHKPEAKSYGE